MASPQTQSRDAKKPTSNANKDASTIPRVLPDTAVTATDIEAAYMSFIFHCNPALPQDCDVDALREAFRNPPKSGGKSFDTFTVFELVKKFYAKEIKTWTELTIKLGVEPPDPSKDESSQKITQYGVRLKKWLNSLHIKSFFEYLMGIPNEYWTKIPNDPDPTGHGVRDGVAVEDDMALRALLPHIRPKRGRKRPDESETPISAQRPRLSPSSALEDPRSSAVAQWPAVIGSHLPNRLEPPRSALPGLGPGDGPQTPLGYPNSAITPTTRGAFWDDSMEPQSAITPSQSRAPRQRRGAKNVSSAWNLGAPDTNAKARGRPRMAKTPVEGPGYSFQPWNPSQATVQADHEASAQSEKVTQLPTVLETPPAQSSRPQRVTPIPLPRRTQSASEGGRPGRPSISLQVPQRTGGNVRLATPPAPTPPPAVAVNGQQHQPPLGCQPSASRPQQEPLSGWAEYAKEATDQYEKTALPHPSGIPDGDSIPDFYFEKVEDRTNVDTLLAFFMRATQDGLWFDGNGNPAEAATMDEAAAIVNSTMQNMVKTATSPQAFLINLGALAGARTLMTSRPKYYRMPDGDGCHNYSFEWEYRFGHLKGHFNMTQSVPWTMWKRPGTMDGGAMDGVNGDAKEDGLSGDDWKDKYKALLGEMQKKDKELADLRGKVMFALREDLT